MTTSMIIRDDFESAVSAYWDSKKDDFNLLLAQDDNFVHHHLGIGDFDRTLLQHPSRDAVNAEIHRLENNQVQCLIDALGKVEANNRLLDGGSGRGGTSFMLYDEFQCNIDGVTIAPYQCEFSQAAAQQRGISDKVHFHFKNMLNTGFHEEYFDYIVTNETTMYVLDLMSLFGEFKRIVRPFGRYVFATWWIDDTFVDENTYVTEIDVYYRSKTHKRSEYLWALMKNGFVPNRILDLTEDATPYWELRLHSESPAVAKQYLEGYAKNALNYVVVSSDYIPLAVQTI